MSLLSFMSGGAKSIEAIASEWIQTDLEQAQAGAVGTHAKTALLTAIDPNGRMRRDLTRFTCRAFGGYLIVMSILAIMAAFNVSGFVTPVTNVAHAPAKDAMVIMSGLFLPITGAFTAILTASFGVNANNVSKAAKVEAAKAGEKT